MKIGIGTLVTVPGYSRPAFSFGKVGVFAGKVEGKPVTEDLIGVMVLQPGTPYLEVRASLVKKSASSDAETGAQIATPAPEPAQAPRKPSARKPGRKPKQPASGAPAATGAPAAGS